MSQISTTTQPAPTIALPIRHNHHHHHKRWFNSQTNGPRREIVPATSCTLAQVKPHTQAVARLPLSYFTCSVCLCLNLLTRANSKLLLKFGVHPSRVGGYSGSVLGGYQSTADSICASCVYGGGQSQPSALNANGIYTKYNHRRRRRHREGAMQMKALSLSFQTNAASSLPSLL